MADLVFLIPVFNNLPGLLRTLPSLYREKEAFDIVVVDDGSNQPIHREALPQCDGKHISILRMHTNRGITHALNHGLSFILRKNYTYVARIDSGDILIAGRVTAQKRYLEANRTCGVISSFVDFVDSNQTLVYRYTAPLDHQGIIRRMRLNNCIVHAGAMFRADVFKTVGVYDASIPLAEDYELFLRVARSFHLAVLPEVLTRCEYNFSGLSIAGRRRQQAQRLRIQLRFFDPTSFHSFYGVVRTLVAMMTPHWIVFHYKRAYLGRKYR